MTEEKPDVRKLRRATKYGAIAVVAVLLAGVAYWWLVRTGVAAPPPPVQAPASTQAPAANAATADGCLGGPDPHTAVLAAQQTAPLDSVGAAGFAMAMTRFAFTTPPDNSIGTVIDQVMLDPAATHTAAAAVQWDHELHTYVSGGEYRSINNTGASAVVQVKVNRSDINGQASTVRMVVEWHLTAVLGHWRAAPVSGPTVGAEPFADGFVPYLNVGCGR